MKKRKKWELFLIVLVIALTIYNILPTIFYYSKPLRAPIEKDKAIQVAHDIANRINKLEQEAIDWLYSYCSHLKIKPLSIQFDSENVQHIIVKFNSEQNARKFRTYFSRAGSLISPIESRLFLSNQENDPKTILVQRLIPIHFEKDEISDFFRFTSKKTNNGEFSDLHKQVVFDRAATVVEALSNTSFTGIYPAKENGQATNQDLVFSIATQLNQLVDVFGHTSPVVHRFFSNFSKESLTSLSMTPSKLINLFEQTNDQVKLEKIELQKKEASLKKEGKFLEDAEFQKLHSIQRKEETISLAKQTLKNNKHLINIKDTSINRSETLRKLEKDFNGKVQVYSLNNANPFIKEIVIDWNNDKITLIPFADLIDYKSILLSSDTSNYKQDLFNQLFINEIARVTRLSDETILSADNEFYFNLNQLTNSQSFLSLDLDKIAKKYSRQITKSLSQLWKPKHPELQPEQFPIVDNENYQHLSVEQKPLCLTVLLPSDKHYSYQGMKNGSIYVIARGMNRILEKYTTDAESSEAHTFIRDFHALKDLLAQYGFIGYPASHFMNEEFVNDYIFELDNFYNTLLTATHEDFHTFGSKKFATLEFTDLEQRILTQNKIETKMHEDLLKWKDDFQTAQISIDEESKNSVPPPTKSPFWHNLKLSLKKYFRGDERKVLHWGLDLSGGKTVSIELRDQNNKTVKQDTDLKQGMNELYNRVNKMGISEVSIRSEGSHILLDFPGSQNFSANELVKASSMYFHVVNEKFSPRNNELGNLVNQFLQEIWNEAVVTNQKDPESINAIAWKHLYGDTSDSENPQPRTPTAKILYENGLRLASTHEPINNQFNDAISKIALIRGESFTKWFGQSHPLMIVFRNFALEGSSLTNIRSSYDPSKGNFLSFEVKGTSVTSGNQKTYPRSDLFNWTSQFAKEKIEGTKNETYTNGQGWRMAVLLNDTVISAPTLDSALRDSAMISGNFTQRETNQLASDLKAGSLTFTPKILSEKNVSPELGKQDRLQGIIATVAALILVICAMTTYYRFAGLIASIAVIFNLIIVWAALQNLNATLTLSGIAGIILTVGMAVDANVLVFERIKEEFSLSGRIAQAIQAGYKKAFTAILDSNLTTIIAALILLNFDSGPIKGFAVTLIIGIASSMFTALFMTKYFFSVWVQNPKHTKLNMMHLIKGANFNFLKNSKVIFIISSLIILCGAVAMNGKKNTLFGTDFTGGYALNVELESTDQITDYRSAVEQALLENGANKQDFSVRSLSPSNHLRILFSTSMKEKGKPFYGLTNDMKNNPQITWVVNTLQTSGLKIANDDLTQNWSNVSGQMSDSMKNSAIFSLALALIAILIYITIRFEWKYSISALICLIHDVLVSVGVLSILHALKFPVQIDLNTIAALMTIIGYSLNDTIIIFDRIREDIKTKRKISLADIVNQALNETLSRTLITSATTFLVLLALVLLGGNAIFSFALVMCVGVVFGTLSSLFIASPLMLFFHKIEQKREQKVLTSNKV